MTVPGAPLDHNTAERALKLCIRPRKTALFYAPAHSASVASRLTRVSAPCRPAGVKALAYGVAGQDNRRAVFATPGAWLPWA